MTDEFREELDIKIEATALKSDIVDAVASKDLVHREGIAQPLAKQHVEKPSEEHMTKVHEAGDAALLAKVTYLPVASVGRMARAENKTGFQVCG